MRQVLMVALLLLLTASMYAQLRLNVAGDAKITGRMDLSSGANNMIIGTNAGKLTTGSFNTFLGLYTGVFNTTGESNTFVGLFAGYSNTIGKDNTFMGAGAGIGNTDGFQNTFLGKDAGRFNTTGISNTFSGFQAGYSNTTGATNTFLGVQAGFNNKTGYHNTFVGERAGVSNTSGQTNVFVGRSAGSGNTTGQGNTLVGHGTGSRIGFTGSFNTFLGDETGRDNKSGDRNTFLGTNAGFQNDSGQQNTFVGLTAGGSNITGSFNTFVGTRAGNSNETGDNLVALGYQASASLLGSAPIDDAFALGYNSIMLQSHSGVIGNIGIQRLGSYVNIGTASDGRMKKQVKEDVHGLDFILQLRPVSYQVDALKLDQFLRLGMEEVSAGKAAASAEEKAQAQERQQTYQNYLREKSAIRYTGFIAQEVEKAMNDSGFEFSGLVKPAHDKDHYSLRYAEFVVPLVKGMQEQQELIKKQEKEQEVQLQQIEQLQTEVTELKALVRQLLVGREDQTPVQQFELQPKQQARLSQNYPNPFQEDTLIDYFIPETVKNARLEIHAVDGKHLGSIPIQNIGTGKVLIKAASYPAGTYLYSLVLDGEVATSLQMVLTR